MHPDADALDAFQELPRFGKVWFQVLVDVLVDLFHPLVQQLDDGLDATLNPLGCARQSRWFGYLD
jgi:hypothetical protein